MIALIFDQLTTQEVLAASHVNKRWRSIGIGMKEKELLEYEKTLDLKIEKDGLSENGKASIIENLMVKDFLELVREKKGRLSEFVLPTIPNTDSLPLLERITVKNQYLHQMNEVIDLMLDVSRNIGDQPYKELDQQPVPQQKGIWETVKSYFW